MKKIFACVAVFATFFLTSCISTEEVHSGTEASENLVISLSAPSEAVTRAGSDYKLRYTAKIFQGRDPLKWNSPPIDTQEILEGETQNNQIVFQVAPNDYYGIIVFADYIPADATRDSKRSYGDYFYTTSAASSPKRVTVRTTPGSTSTAISPEFFNNPYYDAFFAISPVIDKKEAQYDLKLTLNRITAKVIVRDNSDNIAPESAVMVNKLGVIQNFDQNTITASGNTDLSGNISISDKPQVDYSQRDLFYFYTLADASERQVSTSFKVTANDKTSDPFDVTGIPVKANFQTIVSGSFLPASSTGGNGGSGDNNGGSGGDPSTKEGDIILNLSTNYTWEQETLSR